MDELIVLRVLQGNSCPKGSVRPAGSSRLDYCDLSAVDHEGVAGYIATEIAC